MNKSMAEIERTQAELDGLYGELSATAGGPAVARLMKILEAADAFLQEARDRALALEHAHLGIRLIPLAVSR